MLTSVCTGLIPVSPTPCVPGKVVKRHLRGRFHLERHLLGRFALLDEVLLVGL